MPEVIGIAFHGGDDFVHLVQDLQPLAAVHVALEKLEHIQAIARVLLRESEINQKGKARKLWDIEEGKGI